MKRTSRKPKRTSRAPRRGSRPARNASRRSYAPGTRWYISEGSGTLSNRWWTIIPWSDRRLKFDHYGIPRGVAGAYSQPDRDRWVAVVSDDGYVDMAPKSHLRSAPPVSRNAHGRLTKRREAQFRQMARSHEAVHPGELLAEIDALRADLLRRRSRSKRKRATR